MWRKMAGRLIPRSAPGRSLGQQAQLVEQPLDMVLGIIIMCCVCYFVGDHFCAHHEQLSQTSQKSLISTLR